MCTVTESATVIRVSGEGLLRVCTELPSGHRFKTAAQDQSQSESSASELIKCPWKVKKETESKLCVDLVWDPGTQVYSVCVYVWKGICVQAFLFFLLSLTFSLAQN